MLNFMKFFTDSYMWLPVRLLGRQDLVMWPGATLLL